MSDTVNKAVIHALVKEQSQAIQPSIFRSQVLDPQHEAVQKLVEEIRSIYGSKRNSAQYGVFREDEGRGAFPDAFETYAQQSEPSDDTFMALTRTAMDRLYDKAASSPLASGGYIVFADCYSSQERYFLVAMVKQRPGLTLNAQLEPEELQRLDLDKLHQAARINFSRLAAYLAAGSEESQEMVYLSFISPKGAKQASGYFITALGCTAGAASARATETVFRESKRLFRETDGLRPNRDAFRNSLVAYMEEQEAAGESVKLWDIAHVIRRHIPTEMAEQADELVDGFVERLNSEEFSVPAEFHVSRRALKRHTHIAGEGDNWKLSFDRNALGENPAASIQYDRERGAVTINGLPKRLTDAIEEELDYRVTESAEQQPEESERAREWTAEG